jgi:hypothetical protein
MPKVENGENEGNYSFKLMKINGKCNKDYPQKS